MGTEQIPQNMQPPPGIFGEPPHPIPDLDALRAEYAKELSENEVGGEEDYEDDDEEDYEDDDEEDYDGHPAWYEPTQCSLCDKLFTPSNEEQCYCDDCEFREEKD
jgi:hypothetical protein